MLWLIWIALMIAVPSLAGLELWLSMRGEPAEPPAPAIDVEKLIV